jgi:CheY-like chemotaxis protein
MGATPTVYFIDDSATMREVIKIAFRRENINVVACHDATLALSEIEKTKPDIVITDVIMPDKDGYDVCQYIKSHPEISRTPVILMSGVVNRAVAERAFAVKANELLRKPFQPQDLIARVKHLLKPNGAPVHAPGAAANAAVALTSIFSSTPASRPAAPAPAAPLAPKLAPAPAASSTHSAAAVAVAAPPIALATAPVSHAPVPVATVDVPVPARHGNGNGHHDSSKLKIEILRLEGLVKKLQSELQAEREYCRALEEHVKTLQEAD